MNKKLILKLLSLLIAVAILLPMGLPGAVFAAEDGTMEFVDECEDFSKVYSKTGCLEVVSEHPERYYNNDTSRFMRSIAARSGDNLAQYVIYKVPGRITDIDINTAICGGGPFDFKFFLSGNGRDFTELPVERDEPGKGDNWSFVFYRANGLTGSEQYLKILWTGTDPNGQWAEQVNRVVINYKRDTSLSGVAMYNPDYTDTTPADVTGLNSKSDIRTVCGLDLLEKNELGNFKPNDLIIRKEFLTAVCKMFGLMPLDKTSPEEPGELLKIQGYIDEDADETSNILYEEAVEILVKALGYGDAVKADTSAEYIKKASNLKLLNNVECGSGDNITRENAAVLLANALETNIMDHTGFGTKQTYKVEKGVTPLSEYMEIYKGEGIVSDTSVTGLAYDTSDLSKDSVRIDGYTYKIGSSDAIQLLGYKVEFYYKEKNGGYELVYLAPSDDVKVIDLTYDDIKEATVSGEVYYTDGGNKTKKITITSVADMIYNGKSIRFDRTLFDGEDNRFRFILNDGNKCDVVFVKHFDEFVVDRQVSNTGDIYNKYAPEKELKLDVYSSTISYFIVKDGKEIVNDDLKEWDVLSVERAAGSDGMIYVKAYASDKKVNGEIDSVSAANGKFDYVEINGTKYDVSSAYEKAISLGNAPELKIGREGTFTLNVLGEIAAFDMDEIIEGYAYLTEAGPDDSSRSKNVYRIFTDKGVWMNFKSEEYLKINDKRVKNADVVQMLKESCIEYDPVKSPDSIGQLIKYHMDTEGNIKSIYIVKPENDWVKQGIDYNNRPVVNDQLVRTFYKEQPKFYTRNYCFYFTDSNKAINFFATDDDTVIFHIPGREYDPNDMGEEHYKVLDRKSMGDYRYMWTDFYNVDRFGNIGAVVSRDSNRNEIYPAEGVYMIEDAVKGVNDKLDETAVKLTVRSAMSASHPQQELYVSPDAEIVKIDKRASVDPKSQGVFTKFDFGDVGAGDIVQFKFDAYNRIRYIYLWADASMLISNPNYTAFLSNGGDVGGEVAVAYGSVKELNLQKQIVNIETRVDMSDEGANTTMHCLGSLLQNVFIVECKNGKPNSVSRSTLSGIAEGDKVVVYFMKQYPSTIVVMRNF